MTKIRCIVKWLLPLKGVEQLAAFGLGGLQAFRVLAGDEQAGDEAAQQGEDDGDDEEHRD